MSGIIHNITEAKSVFIIISRGSCVLGVDMQRLLDEISLMRVARSASMAGFSQRFIQIETVVLGKKHPKV